MAFAAVIGCHGITCSDRNVGKLKKFVGKFVRGHPPPSPVEAGAALCGCGT